jgi:DNA-directed RNA polymerase subunit N (RpoN/RPB10)
VRNNSGVLIMENREKIIQLFKNPLVTGYGIEIMSNGRLYSANFQRYKNRVKKEENPLIIFESMTEKVEQVFLELAEEVIRTNPKTKQESREMIKEYSYKEDNKW